MLFDCFTFFNELDLLEFRLKLLSPYVDYFVIVESNLAHSGKPKPFYFKDREERFKPWSDKIIYSALNQSTNGLVFNQNEQEYNKTNGSWKLENEQRNALHHVAEFMDEADIIVIGDLDEIPDPYVLKEIKLLDQPHSLSMIFHNYFMNCRNSKAEKLWNGSVLCNGKMFKENLPQVFRDNRNHYPKIKNGGWHFSYLGGIEKIKYKIKSFAHTEYNKDEFLNDDHILNSLNNGEDIFKRKNVRHKLVPLDKYPRHVRRFMMQYPQFISHPKEMRSFQKVLNFFKWS